MPSPRRIALATHGPEIAYDSYFMDQTGLSKLRNGFERLGSSVESVVWYSDVDWSEFDAVLPIVAWGYHDRLSHFNQWVYELENTTLLLNKPEVLRWNSDKRYLAELARGGVPVIDSVFVNKGQAPSLMKLMKNWQNLFIKPTVSADGEGSMKVSVGDSLDAKQQEFQRLLNQSHSGLIVQPYIEAAEKSELSLIMLGGVYSHAVQMDIGGSQQRSSAITSRVQPDNRALDIAQRAVDALPFKEPPTYMRLDLVQDEGQYKVMEAEMIEPCLYLDDGGAKRLAEVVLNKLQHRQNFN